MSAFLSGVVQRLHLGSRGMTLVEVMVAMLILTVVFSALASVLTASLRTLHGNENRVKANAVVTQLLEELHALDWAEVGFSSADHGYRPAVNVDTGEPCNDPDADATDPCEATVTFASSSDVPDDPRPLPLRDGQGGAGTETIERDGTDYEVRTDITWVDDPSAAGTQDYKRFRIAVTWTDIGSQRSVTHSATRAPNPDEQNPAPFSLRTVTVYPTLGFINGPGETGTGKLDAAIEFAEDGTMTVDDTVDAVAIDVVTTEPVDAVTVTFVNRDGNTVTESLSERDLDGDGDLDGTEWSLSSSLSSSWQYRNGDTTFVITATRTDTGAEATITEPVRYVYEDNDITAMEIDGTSHSVDPDATSPHVVSQVCVQDDGTVAQDLSVRLTTRGMTLDDRVDVAGPGFAADTSLSATEATLDGALFDLVVEAGHAFPDPDDTDRALIDFTAVRQFDEEFGGTQTRSLALELLAPDEWGGTKCET